MISKPASWSFDWISGILCQYFGEILSGTVNNNYKNKLNNLFKNTHFIFNGNIRFENVVYIKFTYVEIVAQKTNLKKVTI